MTTSLLEICVNGSFFPENQPVLTASDRGLLLGDGLFETIRVYQQKPFLSHQHLTRMLASARHFRFPLLPDSFVIHSWLQALIERNQIQTGYARVTLTRGLKQSPGLYLDQESHPQIIIETKPLEYRDMTWNITMAEVRRSRTSLISAHKTTNYLENLMVLDQAKNEGFDEAILCVEEGLVQEGTRTNLFFVEENQLFTPPLELGPLPGITRGLVMNQLQHGYPVTELPFAWDSVRMADEVFLTNSLWGIIEVSRVDELHKPSGKVTQKLKQVYLQYVQSFKETKI
ncbi:MAG: aminotransferase class IV [SAR324 cluster bacterium]|nr:aminotransferase class IV [SAR324 cluster bacterium]